MPTSKQRREAARRHLERQLERRQQREARRRRFVLIASIAGTVIVIVAIVAAVTVLGSGSTTPAAASSNTPSPSASPAALAKTAGPCGYTRSAQVGANTNLKDVGVPPDPSPTPTENRTMTINTNKGVITIALDGSLAPCNVQSIAYLAGKGFYNNSSCHRLVTSGIYVLQCGDPSGTGSGGPTYTVKDENLAKASYNTGVVAMANAGAGTNGSQFFIMYKDSTMLPKNYTEIGTVTQGMNIVQQVAAGGSDNANGQGDGKPKVTLTFQSVTVQPPVTGSGTLVPASSASAPASGSAPSSSAPSSSVSPASSAPSSSVPPASSPAPASSPTSP